MPVYDFPDVEPPNKEPGVGKVVFAIVITGSACVCIVVAWLYILGFIG